MNKFCSFLRSFFRFQGVEIDNHVFRLHYQLTLPLLVILSICVTFRQYFGSTINCIPKLDYDPDFFNNYCYIHSTYSNYESWTKVVGEQIPYPGMDKYNPDQTRIYHTYYQWVSLALLLQAVLFYVPWFFWNTMESGKVKELMDELKHSSGDEDLRQGNMDSLADFVLSSFSHNGKYFASYALAEVLNAVNVIGQIFLMDVFLGGGFGSYGLQVIKFRDWNWSTHYDPMNRVFPKMAKCTFHRFGTSGDVERHETTCLLPINAFNEKIYLFLWFWFIIVAILSCLAIVYRIVICMSSKVRILILDLGTPVLIKKEDLEMVLSIRSVGDWFVIRLLSKNFNSVTFREFLSTLVVRMDNKNAIELLED